MLPFFKLQVASTIIKADINTFLVTDLVVGPSVVAFTAQYIASTFTGWAKEHWQIRGYVFKYLASMQMAAIELAASVPGHTTADLEAAAAEYIAGMNKWVAAAAADQKAYYEVLSTYMLGFAPDKAPKVGRALLREKYSEEQLMYFVDRRIDAPATGIYTTDAQKAAIAAIAKYDDPSTIEYVLIPMEDPPLIDTAAYETAYSKGTAGLYAGLLAAGVTVAQLNTITPPVSAAVPPSLAQIIKLNVDLFFAASYRLYNGVTGTYVALNAQSPRGTLAEFAAMLPSRVVILSSDKQLALEDDLARIYGFDAHISGITYATQPELSEADYTKDVGGVSTLSQANQAKSDAAKLEAQKYKDALAGIDPGDSVATTAALMAYINSLSPPDGATVHWAVGQTFYSASGDYPGMRDACMAEALSYSAAIVSNYYLRINLANAWFAELQILQRSTLTPTPMVTVPHTGPMWESPMWADYIAGATYDPEEIRGMGDWGYATSYFVSKTIKTYSGLSSKSTSVIYKKVTVAGEGAAGKGTLYTPMTSEIASELESAFKAAEVGAREMEMAIDAWWNDISGSTIDYWKAVSQGHMKTLVKDASGELIKRIPASVAAIVINGLLLAATVEFAPVAATVGVLEASLIVARTAVAGAGAGTIAMSEAEALVLVLEAKYATATAALATGGGLVTSVGYHLFLNLASANLLGVSGLSPILDSISTKISNMYAGSWLDNVIDAALPDDPVQSMPDWATSAMVRKLTQRQSKNEYVEFANGTFAHFDYATQESSYGWIEDYKELYKKTHPEMQIPLFTDPGGSTGTNAATGAKEIPVQALPSIAVPSVFRGGPIPLWAQQYCREWGTNDLFKH